MTIDEELEANSFVDIPFICAATKSKPTTVFGLFRDGELPRVKLGKKTLTTKAALSAYQKRKADEARAEQERAAQRAAKVA